jgi:hypothetical protein
MKKVLFSLMMVFAAGSMTAVMAQDVNKQVTDGAKIEFEKETHDYGEVKYDGNGQCTFKFTNTGSEPLIIQNAKGSCGCTVPDWPKQPIAPGESAVITVKYDTKRPGAINKSVTITSNAVNEPVKVVRIKGNVLPKPVTGAPINTGGPTN